jgi:hypothetical protein
VNCNGISDSYNATKVAFLAFDINLAIRINADIEILMLDNQWQLYKYKLPSLRSLEGYPCRICTYHRTGLSITKIFLQFGMMHGTYSISRVRKASLELGFDLVEARCGLCQGSEVLKLMMVDWKTCRIGDHGQVVFI